MRIDKFEVRHEEREAAMTLVKDVQEGEDAVDIN